VTVTLLVFVAWQLVTTLFALFPDSAWSLLNKTLKIQAGVLLTLFVIQDKNRIIWLVRVMALSIAFYGVKGGLFTLRTGGAGHVLGPPGGFIAGNTEIALAITMAAPLVYYLAETAERRWVRWSLYGVLALCAVGVIGSYSRGGLLAIVAMVLFLWLKSRRKALLLFLIPPVIVLIAFTVPERWYQRMDTIGTYQEDASAMGRLNSWGFALNLTKDRPIAGGGYGVFHPAAFDRWSPNLAGFQDAHSIWFEVLGEHGYVGLFLYLLLWWLAWRAAKRVIRMAKKDPALRWARELVAMCQVSLIGFFVGGTFLGLAYWDFPYLLAAVIVLTELEVTRYLKQTAEGAAKAAVPARPLHQPIHATRSSSQS
jgi:probable O-glycosylation ligase (exosortase A-associated)